MENGDRILNCDCMTLEGLLPARAFKVVASLHVVGAAAPCTGAHVEVRSAQISDAARPDGPWAFKVLLNAEVESTCNPLASRRVPTRSFCFVVAFTDAAGAVIASLTTSPFKVATKVPKKGITAAEVAAAGLTLAMFEAEDAKTHLHQVKTNGKATEKRKRALETKKAAGVEGGGYR